MRISLISIFLIAGIIFFSNCSSDSDFFPNESTDLNLETRGEGCTVSISIDTSNPANCSMVATPSEACSGKVSYYWSTPYGTNNYNLPTGTADGEYCVTITDTKGCTASDCITVEDCADSCENSECDFEFVLYDHNCSLGILAAGCELPVQYDWTYPQGGKGWGSRIDVSEDGEYCLTITTEDGCEVSKCIDIEDCDEEGPLCPESLTSIHMDIIKDISYCKPWSNETKFNYWEEFHLNCNRCCSALDDPITIHYTRQTIINGSVHDIKNRSLTIQGCGTTFTNHVIFGFDCEDFPMNVPIQIVLTVTGIETEECELDFNLPVIFSTTNYWVDISECCDEDESL